MKFSSIKAHLGRYTVGIAGAGGLGSNCAAALVRSGIGRLVIADYDIVEKSNLNRQYYFADQVGMKKTDALKENLKRIDSDVEVETIEVKLNRENIPVIFSNCDIIVEAFDSSDMKEMIAEAVIEAWPDRPLVIGSGLAGYGKSNKLRERKIGKTIYICGDQESETTDELPALAPRVGIVANMQANVVLEVLMKKSINEDKTKQ